MIADNTFREDLYYRISVIPILIPPLRDRDEDVALLAKHFLRKFVSVMGKTIERIEPQLMDLLKGYDWPGNVRQLENTIERAVAMETTNELHVDLMSGSRKTGSAALAIASAGGTPGISIPAEGIEMEKYVADIERSLLQSALRRATECRPGLPVCCASPTVVFAT